MSEILLYNICPICLFRIYWYNNWIGLKRCEEAGCRGWARRAHYKCWKKEQEDGRAGASQMAVPRMDDEYTLRVGEPKP